MSCRFRLRKRPRRTHCRTHRRETFRIGLWTRKRRGKAPRVRTVATVFRGCSTRGFILFFFVTIFARTTSNSRRRQSVGVTHSTVNCFCFCYFFFFCCCFVFEPSTDDRFVSPKWLDSAFGRNNFAPDRKVGNVESTRRRSYRSPAVGNGEKNKNEQRKTGARSVTSGGVTGYNIISRNNFTAARIS